MFGDDPLYDEWQELRRQRRQDDVVYLDREVRQLEREDIEGDRWLDNDEGSMR